MIYFIHAPAMDAVKIGVTNDPWRRLKLLQTGSPCPLILLAFEEGDAAKERELHQRFAEHRTQGEWFAYGRPIADYVSALPEAVAKKRERLVTDIATQSRISKSYASALVNGQRASVQVILHVFNTAGWKHPALEGADEATLRLLGERFPYVKSEG